MVRMGAKLCPEAHNRSVTSRRVNSTSQSGSGAVMMTSQTSSAGGGILLLLLVDQISGLLPRPGHAAPAGDDGAVIAEPDPAAVAWMPWGCMTKYMVPLERTEPSRGPACPPRHRLRRGRLDGRQRPAPWVGPLRQRPGLVHHPGPPGRPAGAGRGPAALRAVARANLPRPVRSHGGRGGGLMWGRQS